MIDSTLVSGFIKGKNSVALGALFCVMNTFAMSPNPEDVISTITQEILSEIKNDPSLVKGDLESINLLVEKKVILQKTIKYYCLVGLQQLNLKQHRLKDLIIKLLIPQ